MTLHYHGTPITPRTVLHELAGRHFAVSHAEPRDVETVHRIGQSVMLDNGAFTAWQQGRPPDWDAWAAWAEPWLDHWTTWAVLPDVIDGDEDANDKLLLRYARHVGRWEQLAPVWHLHEPLSRLVRLCAGYKRVCFGSSGAYREIGTQHWHHRVAEAFNAITDHDGRVRVPIHMLRGMSQAGGHYPFASLDSTDIARNHHRPGNGARRMADWWDAQQCPGRWTRVEQLALDPDLAAV